MAGFLHRDDVTPIPKPEPRSRAPRKRLPRVGKKGRRDARELRATKPILMARSGGWCEAHFSGYCTGVGQEQHHILPRSQGGTNDPEGLLWLCSQCHTGPQGVHAMPIAAKSRGLLAGRLA